MPCWQNMMHAGWKVCQTCICTVEHLHIIFKLCKRRNTLYCSFVQCQFTPPPKKKSLQGISIFLSFLGQNMQSLSSCWTGTNHICDEATFFFPEWLKASLAHMTCWFYSQNFRCVITFRLSFLKGMIFIWSSSEGLYFTYWQPTT